MHSVLFVVVKTDPLTIEQKVWWPKLVKELREISAINMGTQILSDNVLMIPMKNGPQGLHSAVAAADEAGLQHLALYFEGPPEWVSSSERSS